MLTKRLAALGLAAALALPMAAACSKSNETSTGSNSNASSTTTAKSGGSTGGSTSGGGSSSGGSSSGTPNANDCLKAAGQWAALIGLGHDDSHRAMCEQVGAEIDRAAFEAAYLQAEQTDTARAGRFRHRVALDPWPDLTAGYRYLGIDRMSYYVNKDAYRGAVRAETAALHQPSQTNGAAR